MMDPSLKYATGVLKGRPLDSAGMPYRIIERDGIEVALFQNGAMARFYRDPIEDQKMILVAGASSLEREAAASVALDTGDYGTRRACNNPDCSQDYGHGDPCDKPQRPVEAVPVKTVHPRMTIGKYIMHGHCVCDPAYCVLENGTPVYNAAREVVGQGLREYLWLYAKLREFGRGCFQAAWEARSIYFL